MYGRARGARRRDGGKFGLRWKSCVYRARRRRTVRRASGTPLADARREGADDRGGEREITRVPSGASAAAHRTRRGGPLGPPWITRSALDNPASALPLVPVSRISPRRLAHSAECRLT